MQMYVCWIKNLCNIPRFAQIPGLAAVGAVEKSPFQTEQQMDKLHEQKFVQQLHQNRSGSQSFRCFN